MRAVQWVIAAAALGSAGALGAPLQGGREEPRGGGTTISLRELPSGEVIIQPSAAQPGEPAKAAVLIGKTMTNFLTDKKRRVRAAVGIVSGGNTLEVHLWCDPAPPAPARRTSSTER